MHDVFFFTDIHGMSNLYHRIIDYCITKDPECTIIFGGDACDRGPNGYHIMKDLLSRPNVIYLKGNHEDIFVKAAYEIEKHFDFKNVSENRIHHVLNSTMTFDYKYSNIQTSIYNGGMDTLVDWVMDGMPMNFVKQIEALPLTFSWKKYDFCHAAGVYRTFREVSECEYYHKPIDEYLSDSIMWSRSAFDYGWETDRIAVFGHTPVTYLLQDLGTTGNKFKPYKYTGKFDEEMTGEKIDMDTGACFTGYAYVLNCLTGKYQGYYYNKETNEIQILTE